MKIYVQKQQDDADAWFFGGLLSLKNLKKPDTFSKKRTVLFSSRQNETPRLEWPRPRSAEQVGGQRWRGNGKILTEYSRSKSSRNNRLQRAHALPDGKRTGAVLLSERRDRLASNAAFIANLLEAGRDLGSVDAGGKSPVFAAIKPDRYGAAELTPLLLGRKRYVMTLRGEA